MSGRRARPAPPDAPLPDPRGLYWARETLAADVVLSRGSFSGGLAPYLLDAIPAATILTEDLGCVSLAYRE